MIGLGSTVDSALAPGHTLGSVIHVTDLGRCRVLWDDGTNSSHPPAELVVITSTPCRRCEGTGYDVVHPREPAGLGYYKPRTGEGECPDCYGIGWAREPGDAEVAR